MRPTRGSLATDRFSNETQIQSTDLEQKYVSENTKTVMNT
jgi:hypothetical protein